MEKHPPLQRLKQKLTKENLWLYILSLLREREMYGYEIRKYIKERFGFSSAVVTAYVVLYKLQVEGYVETKWQKSPIGRPDRKYYSITEKGIELLNMAKKYLAELFEKLFKEKISVQD